MDKPSFELDLWAEGEIEESALPEIEEISPGGLRQYRNVTHPTLTAYLPPADKANGTAVIICPGGAFRVLVVDYEGTSIARWFQEHGVAAFVLKYRLVETPPDSEEFEQQMKSLMSNRDEMQKANSQLIPLAISDGLQAVKLVRQYAAEWNIASDRIGIMGFSAGGRVTAGVALTYNEESRPSFAAPIYGGLWGDDNTVPVDAPPLFTAVAGDDELAVNTCLNLYRFWLKAGKSAELHIYAKGGHGFGLKKQNLPSDSWIDRLGDWLKMQNLL